MERNLIFKGKNKIFLAITIFLIVNILLTGIAIAKTPSYLWATGGFGGRPYVSAGAAAHYLNRGSFGEMYRLSIQPSAGTVENVRRMEIGEIDIANIDSHIFFWYQLPSLNWNERYVNSRAVMRAYTASFPLVTLERSGIKTFNDMIGKRVSLGPIGSGNSAVATEVVRALGLYDKIDATNHPWNQGPEELADGRVDVCLSSTVPTGYLEELSTTHQIVWVGLSKEEESIVIEKLPFFPTGWVPAVHGVKEEVRGMTISSWIFAHKDVPEDVIYNLLKHFITEEGLEYGGSVTPVWKEWTIEKALDGLPIPLHPGAEKFWREIGVEIPKPLDDLK